MITKRILALVLSVVMMFSVAACSEGANSEEKVYRFATTTEPTTIDTHVGNANYMTNVTSTIYEGLVRRYDGEIVPGIAETWDIDGRVYTFHLRDAQWSDGEPVTAQHFVDAWSLLQQTATPMTQFIEYFIDENGNLMVEAIDEKTLQVTLNKDVAFIMEYLASPVMIPLRIDAFNGNQESYYQNVPTVVNGPFNLVEWTSNDIMVFEPNETYWNAEAVNFDRVEIYTVKDTQTQVNMYEGGEIDMVDVPSSMFAQYEDSGMVYYEDGGIQFLQIPAQGSSEESAKFLRNRDFVEALSYAIDREDFVNSVFAGSYSPAITYVPQTSTGYIGGAKGESSQTIDTPYQTKADTAKAEESLQKALDTLGYTKETMPTFVLMVTDSDANQMAAQYIQDVTSKIGINIEIKAVPGSTFWSLVMNKDPHDFSLGGFGPDIDDATSFLSSYTSTGGYSVPFLGWESEEYNALYEASWEATGDARSELLVEMEEYLLFNGPTMPIYTTRGAWMLNEEFTNINKNTTGTENDFVFGDKV